MRIRVDHVTKKFGYVAALKKFTVEMEEGHVIAVLGRNGAGKTTLLRSLAGLVVPDEGKTFYDGEEFHRGRMDLRRRFLFLPDFPPFFTGVTVAWHISTALRLFGKPVEGVEDRVVEYLNALDMLPMVDTPVAFLSRGQTYKAALATLFAVDPEVWLLDEPFASGMDPHGIMYFKKQAREAAARGRTVIYSTQILDVAENFSDRVCLIEKGELRFYESVEGLRRHTTGDNVLEEIFQQLREERQ
jgi:ABC-type multidrug transport system ATPase subunit